MVTTMDIDVTFSCEGYSEWLLKIVQLRNEVIGSNARKETSLVHISKITGLLTDSESPYELKLECCIVLGSIAKGTMKHVKALYDQQVHDVLVKCLTTTTRSTPPTTLPLIEALCRCLRSMVGVYNDAAHFIFQDDSALTCLVHLLSRSACCQESALLIFAYACKTPEQQQRLHLHNAIPNIVQTLAVKAYTVKIAALKCLSALCCENSEVAAAVVACKVGEMRMVERVMVLMRKSNTLDMQLNAAKCLVYLYRAGAIEKSETKLVNKVLSTLVEMCDSDRVWMHRQQGAWHLAYLIEQELALQRTATISVQLLATISDFFNYHINDFDAALLLEGYHGFNMASVITVAENSAKTLGVVKEEDLVASVVGDGVAGVVTEKDGVAGNVSLVSNKSASFTVPILASSSSSLSSTSSHTHNTTPIVLITTPSTIVPMLTDDVDSSSEAKSGIGNKVMGNVDKNKFISEHDKRLQSYKLHLNNLLRISAFNAYAALSANNEAIRKKILDSTSVVGYIKEGLSDPCPSVVNSTLKCLVSLTRSVQQLRTNLNHNHIWTTIIHIFLSSKDEVTLSYTTALFANLLLEFSPCKKHVLKRLMSLEGGNGGSSGSSGGDDQKPEVVMKLMRLTRHHNNAIQLNSIWALMNLCFELSYDEKQIIKSCLLDTNLLFDLIMATTHPDILQRALATIRNIISVPFSSSSSYSPTPSSSFNQFLDLVDGVVVSKGREVMECVVYVLEGDFSSQVKEQALCILTNMASGDEAKDSIMGNADILRKIMNYLIHDNENLQVAAIDCVFNLIWRQYDRYQERKEILRQMQLEKVLLQGLTLFTSPALEIRLRDALDELNF